MAKTVIVKKTSLPDFLPHGWKKEVANTLGIHINTVTNALKAGKGSTYERIKFVAIKKWGNP
ncbi:MAG: hypothetical protein ACK5KL_02810 [Dysgonomonas sp.]|jgi:hypothetical protein|nr:hypothetical protein [Prevotella sp.]MDR3057863.1 hypothetical protein [Prevotella sp.]